MATSASMPHIVLLGDSVFDNSAYVGGGPDVAAQLRLRLPSGWRATLRAEDGAVTSGVARQVEQCPPDATHLIVSAGGNDALRHSGLLDEGARSVAAVLNTLGEVRERFLGDYRAMLDAVQASRLPTAVCTIYDARYPDPLRQRLVITGLTIFNDVITREAFIRGLPLIDLRLICDKAEDYANPIEPSVQGGTKIAAAIAALATSHDWSQRRSTVFAS